MATTRQPAASLRSSRLRVLVSLPLPAWTEPDWETLVTSRPDAILGAALRKSHGSLRPSESEVPKDAEPADAIAAFPDESARRNVYTAAHEPHHVLHPARSVGHFFDGRDLQRRCEPEAGAAQESVDELGDFEPARACGWLWVGGQGVCQHVAALGLRQNRVVGGPFRHGGYGVPQA